jgi:hypothetical protein
MWKLVGTRWNRLAMVWERKNGGEECKAINKHKYANNQTSRNRSHLFSMEDIKNSVASRWQKQPPLKMTFYLCLIYKWKALAHVSSLLPSAKGLSFTFMLSQPISLYL